MRNRILLSAFTRALRDPFAAARQAGVLAMAATQSFYHMEDIANKLLPCLCTVTRDSDKNVRDQVSICILVCIYLYFVRICSSKQCICE